MAFSFEKFTDTDKSFAARVTIRQRTGQIGFNLGAINLFAIREYSHAVLYFDHSQRVVGIGLLNEPEPGAIDIKQSQANTYVRAKNFLDKYAIDYASSHTFGLNRDEESGLLFFVLVDEKLSENSGGAAEADAENGGGSLY